MSEYAQLVGGLAELGFAIDADNVEEKLFIPLLELYQQLGSQRFERWRKERRSHVVTKLARCQSWLFGAEHFLGNGDLA